MKIFRIITTQPSATVTQFALTFLRIGFGLLAIPHGYPKLMGGVAGWEKMGITFVQPLGIMFLPVMWGFLGSATEFFGGIALVLGLWTRLASIALTVMMLIASAWHINKGDSFNQATSFPLSWAVVAIAFIFLGSSKFSLDYLFSRKK